MEHDNKSMTDANWSRRDEVSLFAVTAIVLRNRWRVARWMLAGAVLAAVFIFSRPTLYRASGSFVPQGQADAARSGLASLAGQFGVALPTSNQTLSPDFYARLLVSRELLTRVARDTFVVEEKGRQRVPFLDLFEVSSGSEVRRQEEGTRKLTRIVSASVVKATGVVEFSVETRWPSVSVAIATRLLEEVSRFNQRMRQEQAAAERKFVEGRLGVAGADLRAAEDRLEAFLRTNRQFSSSPDLTFQRERLQRDVVLKQQVFTSLTQSYEEVRIREVRDTPVITVVERPSVPTLPLPTRQLVAILVGLLLGGFFGVLLSFISQTVTNRQQDGDADAADLVGTYGEAKSEIAQSIGWLKHRIRR